MHRIFSTDLVSNNDALWSSYNLINKFVIDHFDNTALTFFTTGILAKNDKTLLRQILLDGHEIASHYYNHNLLYKQSLKEIENELNLSIDSIVNACNVRPIGFRAPAFSVPACRDDIFLLIKKYFKYDSSYVLKNDEIKNKSYLNKEIFKDKQFIEFPIVAKPYLLNNINLKSGGSYFRFFGKKTLKNIMEHSLKYEFTPIIYLHPYDILFHREFWVKLENLNKGYFSNRIKNWLLQHKYLSIGNRSTIAKLKYLSRYFEHQGTLKSTFDKHFFQDT